MAQPSSSALVGAITGSAGITFPFWNQTASFLTGANQLLIAALGLAVLILTARKLWIENKIAGRRLEDILRKDRT